ncbi:dTMP kinase [Serratia sp. NPDC078593]|uniref:dTMP kinase n=1 Tax=unclassified Serratia (in: enterobacteria) TaxID=2647522 RepID=UPI0037CE6ADC
MLINLLGCDGAGKSTQMKWLIPWLQETLGMPLRTLAKRDAVQIDGYPEARYFGCDYRTLMYEILPDMRGESRALFLFNLFAISLCHCPPQEDEIVLLDGGWQKHIATEMALGLDEQWLTQLTRVFPTPDLTLFLDVDPETIVGWRRHNGDTHAPYECGNQLDCSDERFLAQMNPVYRTLLRHADEQGWHIVDGRQPPEQVFRALQAGVEQFLAVSAP